MTPAQLRAVADRIRSRYSPPDPIRMRPGEYVSHEAMQVLAWALDEEAAAEDGAIRAENLDALLREIEARGDEEGRA